MMGKRLVLSAVCLWGSLMSVFHRTPKLSMPNSFNVAVTYMMPVSYPARTLSYGYGVALRNDSAFVYLPYMGRGVPTGNERRRSAFRPSGEGCQDP